MILRSVGHEERRPVLMRSANMTHALLSVIFTNEI